MHHTLWTYSKNIRPIEVFLYEIEMLNATRKLLREVNGDRVQYSAMLESFLLHARSLIDFLEGNRTHEDDLVCSGFTDAVGEPIPGRKLDFDKSFRDSLNKHLAHMTTARLSKKPAWDIQVIAGALNKPSYCFLEKCNISVFNSEQERNRILDSVSTFIRS